MGKKIGLGCLGLGLVAALAVAGSVSRPTTAGVARPGGAGPVGAGGERLPAARRPRAQPGGDRQGRRRLREGHLHRRHRGPRQGGPGQRRRHRQQPQAFAKFQQAQDGLSSALSRLLVVVEKYPDLKATQNFRDLQAQLEGTENRIAVERMRFNETAQAFNTKRMSFPTVIIAGFFGSRFNEKPTSRPRRGPKPRPR